MPIASTTIPPIITASGKPQNAVPAINPICVASKLNCTIKVPMMPARIPNDKEVTNKERQFATKFIRLNRLHLHCINAELRTSSTLRLGL